MEKLRILTIASRLYDFIKTELNYRISLDNSAKEVLSEIPFNVNLENIDKGNLKDIVKTLFDFISIKTSTKNSIGIGNIRNKLLFDYGILDDEMAEIAKW